MTLIVATCQLPVDVDIRQNLARIRSQMEQAHRLGAHVAHFSECGLSGYAGLEFESFDGFDWSLLEASTGAVMELARELRMWVVMGPSHRLSRGHKPHDSLYVLDSRGELVDRYDKRFCTGAADGSTEDLRHYSPGDHPVTFDIDGVRCGLLVCHEFRYPELYREYKRLGVQLILQSFHNGRLTKATLQKRGNPLDMIVRPTLQAHAASNHVWISASNTSRRESPWASFFVRPDGAITGMLRRHTSGVLISAVDTEAAIYDASATWRDRAMRGIFHSGTPVRDPRSEQRTVL